MSPQEQHGNAMNMRFTELLVPHLGIRLDEVAPLKRCGSFKDLDINGNAGWELAGKRYQAPEYEISTTVPYGITVQEALNRITLFEHTVVEKFVHQAEDQHSSKLKVHINNVYATQRGGWKIVADDQVGGFQCTKMISLLMWRDPKIVLERIHEIETYC